MDMQWAVGLGVAIVGIGLATVGRLLKMKASTKQALGGVGIALMVVGIGIVVYGFMARPGIRDARMSTSITQTSPYNSPPIVGNENQVIINPDVNPNASNVIYGFKGERRTTRAAPSFTVNLEPDTPQTKTFQTMTLLENSQNWTALKNLCEEETKKTPEWLTPPLLCGRAYVELGDVDKGIERVEYVQKKAAGRADYAVADRAREEIRQRFGK
jgi:hypothetical protein